MSKRTLEVTPKVISVILEFIKGDLSTRQAGRELGVNHQVILNLTCTLVREWYEKGMLVINETKTTK